MTELDIIVNTERVTAYLFEHGLERGAASLEAVLLQKGGTKGGLPAVLLIATIGDKKHVIKTTLKLLLAATGALNAVTEQDLGPGWRGP